MANNFSKLQNLIFVSNLNEEDKNELLRLFSNANEEDLSDIIALLEASP